MSQAFEAIVALLRRHAAGLVVSIDTDDHFQLDRPVPGGGRPKMEFIASARLGKRYVALHLMPLYCHPELVETMPPSLRARMHGKSCLNFAPHKPIPVEDLELLVSTAMAAGPG